MYTKKYESANSLDNLIAEDLWSILKHPEFPFIALTSTTNGARNFPPYNIIEHEDGTVTLEMAVAGYTKERLSVELQGNCLIVAGKSQNATNRIGERAEKDLVRHQGISNAAFLRTFDMNAYTIVESVELKDGVLFIKVATKKPEDPKRQLFAIK